MPTLAHINHQQSRNGSAGALHLGIFHVERSLSVGVHTG